MNRFRTLLALVVLALFWFQWQANEALVKRYELGGNERSEGNVRALAPPTSGAEIVEVD